MKCCFDTNVLDWVLEDARGSDLMDLVECRLVSAIVAADNAYEVHRIPEAKAAKRARLQALLKAQFFPLAPTLVPISGIARFGLARIATPYVMRLRDHLWGIGIVGLDSNHLINASREGCEVFVTLDKGILSRRQEIGRILGVECLPPEELLARIPGSRGHEAG